MKLKNKKTGEIGELHFEPDKEYHFTVVTEDPADMMIFKTLAELNEEWEDCEELKDFWYIDLSSIMCANEGELTSKDLGSITRRDIKVIKEIGNYFATKEEAELAVRKLKAWKRLKDKGFDFEYVEGYKNLCGNGFEIPITATMPPEAYTDVEVSKDLNLLFGGEE